MTADFAVIFDMDGVLIDSYFAHFQSWQVLAAEEGREYTEADFARGFGRTSREVLHEQWDDGRLTEERIRDLDQRKEAIFRDILARDFPAMSGAKGLIESLHRAGIPVAIGSSGPPPNVGLAVERLGIGKLLTARVTGADVTRGKPDPQVFLLAAERMGMPPARCVVIEDATVGIEAARRAGMTPVGLLSTGHHPSEQAAAALVVRSLGELNVERLRDLVPR